ncbi:MAG: carboxypeptidase-like regulatory domain-containing protein, partial [Flavobacteriales bacterium]|nr:carboxypeptidase-like regulatory domain-containing protein [Flavobacteriales bacterium]
MKKITLLFTAVLISGFCYAQNVITGTVVDAELGSGLPGATVLVKGTSNGVSTDFNGAFTINASESGTLVVSYVGYDSKEIAFSSGLSLGDIALSGCANELDGITVFGTVDFA